LQLVACNSPNNTHALCYFSVFVTIQTAKRALATVDALPAAAQAHAPGLFWTAFRLQVGLPVASAAATATATGAAAVASVTGIERDAALHMLACMAEGVFKKPSTSSSSSKVKSSSSSSNGTGSSSAAVLATPARLMRARHLFATHLAREAAALRTAASDSTEHQQQQQYGLDSTPAFFYYAASYAWLQLLSDGTTAAVRAMTEVLALLPASTTAAAAADGDAATAADLSSPRTLPSLPHYSWAVGADAGAVTAAVERCHTALCELLHCACTSTTAAAAAAGAPRALRAAVLSGLQSYPCNPVLLCLLALGEEHSVSAQRMQHHLTQAQRARRRSDWQRGATTLEWLAWLGYELRRCSAPPPPPTSIADLDANLISTTSVSSSRVTRLSPGEWTPAVRSRMRRCFERAVSSDNKAAAAGSSSPLVWRLYTAFELAAGCYARAKRLHIRAVHACPACRALWVDAAAGSSSNDSSGGLRGAFSAAELDDAIEVMAEKELRLRSRPGDAL
jgi:hypothetical protein